MKMKMAQQFIREYALRSLLPHLNIRLGNGPNDNDDERSGIGGRHSNDSDTSETYYIAAPEQLLNSDDYGLDGDMVAYNDTTTPLSVLVRGSKAILATTVETLTAAVIAVDTDIHYQRHVGGDGGGGIGATTSPGGDNGVGGAAAEMNEYKSFCDGGTLNSSFMNGTAGNATDVESPLSSVYFKATVYLLYIPIFVFALLGNGTVCYIVQSTPRMRTVTNFFIANLAVGDILMCTFCVPFSFVSIFILGYWPFGIALCYLVNYSQAVSVLVSAYTLVAISIDRYIAIMWPLRPRITKRYAKFLIAGVWGIALVTAFPIPIVSKLTQPDTWFEECGRYICHEVWPSNEQYYYYSLALFTLQFILPLAVLIFTYTRIALAVWGKQTPGEAENSRDQRMARSKRKMIKMMVTVVIVFTICWLPFNILVLLLNDDEFTKWKPLPYIWFAFHWLAMSHSCYNPIIYCYMNARFRGGFLQIIYRVPGLRRCCCLRRYLHRRGERSYEATGEMPLKYQADNVGGLLRKPKIRIRNRRCIPSAKSEHMHYVHQHTAKTSSEFYADESIFMCRDHSVAVVPGESASKTFE